MQTVVRLVLIVLWLLPVHAHSAGDVDRPVAATADAPARSTPFNVGFKVVAFGAGRKMAVWYPTSEAESRFEYFRGFAGSVAPNATPAISGRFPLVLFSHGFGGCGTQSVFFTEELARRGYVVAAPDHNDALCGVDGTGSIRLIRTDEMFSRPQHWNDTTQVDRRDDLRRAAHWVFGAAEFDGRIDERGIGVVGHSLGGYTVLGLAGGWRSWQDDRVKAALVFSPYVAPFVVQRRVSAIQVPVMIQAADRDRLIPASSLDADAGMYRAANAPKFYVALRDANHFEWTNLSCFGQKTVAQCLSAKPNAKLIDAYGIAFLDATLKGQPDALSRLDGSGLDDYRHTPR